MSSAPFNSSSEFLSLLGDMPTVDTAARDGAIARDGVLTKPPGALGRLEEIAAWYAGWRGDAAPTIKAPQIAIFAGNHGVTAQGISAFPSEVTAQMVGNFANGGAAINQLAKEAGAKLDVIELTLNQPTADFTQAPAMAEAELVRAMKTGWDAVDPACDLFVAGEMGIGNTTSAAAIALALFGGEAKDWVGPGTGGGREIAAMTGAYASARHKRIPVILDGFIASSAAAVLFKAQTGALDHMIAGHLSEEQAHNALLQAMDKTPILDLGLRLGEGSGAALAIQIVKAALACHSGMATFAEAGVTDG